MPGRSNRARVLCLSQRTPGYGSFSGYEQLARHLSDSCVSACLPPAADRTGWSRIARDTMMAALDLDPVWGDLDILLLRTIARRRYAAAHFLYADNVAPLTLRAARRRGTSVVGTIHDVPWLLRRRLRLPRGRETLGGFDALITLNSVQRDILREERPDVPVEFIPHGVDTGFFCPDADPAGVNGPPTFVSVGVNQRRMDVLLDVARHARTVLPDVRFVIWTSPVLLEGASVPPNTLVLNDQLPDVGLRDLYRAAVASLFLVRDASGHNAVVESLSCGVPVIATGMESNRDYVDDTVGWLVDNNVDDVMRAITEALDERAVAPRRAAARVRAQQQWEWTTIAAAVEATHAQALTAEAARRR